MDNKNQYQHKLLEFYNCAYNSYLASITPSVFLHTMLTKIIKLINGKCGVILKYDPESEKLCPLTHSSNDIKGTVTESMFADIETTKDDWLLFSNYMRNNKSINHDGLMMQSILKKKIMIKYNCKFNRIFGSSKDTDASDFLDDLLFMHKQKTGPLLFVPFVFDGKSNGLMMICNDSHFNDLNIANICEIFKSFSKMMGILFNNIEQIPHHVVNDIDHSITFQILYDTLNIISDSICVTDRDMRIIYKNDSFINMINTQFPKQNKKSQDQTYNDHAQTDKVPVQKNYEQKECEHKDYDHSNCEYLIDMIPSTISLISPGSENNFYRNKMIEITNADCSSPTTINVFANSITSCGSIYHILKFVNNIPLSSATTHTKTQCNTKNHVAYLSHELRNPIQAINTGVYIIDRSIKKIDQLNKHIMVLSSKMKSHSDNLLKHCCLPCTNPNLRDNEPRDPDRQDRPIPLERRKSLTRSYIGTQEPENKDLESELEIEIVTEIETQGFKDSEIETQGFKDPEIEFDLQKERELHISLSDSIDSVDSIDSIESVGTINTTNNNQIPDLSDYSCNINSDSMDSIDSLQINMMDDNDKLYENELADKNCNKEQKKNFFDMWDVYNNIGRNETRVLKNVIKRVNSACKNMSIIIDDILDLSKIENNELIINLDEHSLQDLTDLIYEESKNEANKKNLVFEYEYDSMCPETIYTDNTRVFQIISNLVSNSIKYSTSGIIKFKVTYDKLLNNIVFQISDQGKGIRKEEMSNLFKKYGRTSNSLTDVNSTGLGLCVCQKIASLLGGSIEVTSEYMKGSTFTFVHPIKLGHCHSDSFSDSELIHNITNKDIKGNILIVDNDPNITSLFKLLLRCMNYDKGYDLNIDTVESGTRAFDATLYKSYDLIFMDIDLDGEDGCDVSKKILASSLLNKNCPIIAVTANIKAIQPDRDPKFNCFDDVVLKPFSNTDINKIILKYLSYRTHPDPQSQQISY